MDKIINAETILASGSYTTGSIDLRNWPRTSNQKMGISIIITGTGTIKIEYLIPTFQTGNELGGFVIPLGVTTLASGLTAGSYAAEFNPAQCEGIKLKITETGGSNPVVVTMYTVIK